MRAVASVSHQEDGARYDHCHSQRKEVSVMLMECAVSAVQTWSVALFVLAVRNTKTLLLTMRCRHRRS